MFHRPFRIKTQSAMKGSDRKKLRAEFGRQYPSVREVQLASIFTSRDEMTIAKVCTHGGDDIIIYFLQKNPILFEVHRVIYPTVSLLWKNPDLVPTLTTWPEVFKKLEGGADLMLPGVIVKGRLVGPTTLGCFDKGQGCAVNLHGNSAAVAVGRTLMSSDEMYESAMRGKGVAILHTYCDQLWLAGDRSELPVLSEFADVDPTTLTLTSDGCISANESAAATAMSAVDGQFAGVIVADDSSLLCELGDNGESISNDDVTAAVGLNADVWTEGLADGIGDVECTAAGNSVDDFSDAADGADADVEAAPISKESVDTLLYECFLYALKTGAKKAELPLLTSSFFRNHMIPCCPKRSTLDVKKSSYKKLSKFLAAMQLRGFVQVKELTKGVESIISINREHDDLRSFCIPDWPLSAADKEVTLTACDRADAGFCYAPPNIVDMLQTTSAVLPLLDGRRKGDALMPSEVRQHVIDYVRASNLQDPNNRSLVRLDATLCDAVVPRGEYLETLRWDELVDRCLAKMTPVHRVTFPGCQPQIGRGHIEPIDLDVVQRGANKNVTTVGNLETYGIDAEQFASIVQKGVACSASVAPRPSKPKCTQVVVQGNQINYIALLLREKYQLPAKYIRGLDKAPKAPKKKT